MRNLLELLKSMYDLVLLDGTPSMIVSDSIALSTMVDSTILIAENKVSKINELKKTKRQIQDVGGKIMGVILNKSDVQHNKYYGKGYGYYYGDGKQEKTEKEKTASTDVSFSSYPAFRQAYCCTDTIILQKYASVCKGLLQFSEKLSFSYFKPSPIETTRFPQWQSKVQGFSSMKMMPDCCQTSQTALSDMQLLPAKLQ